MNKTFLAIMVSLAIVIAILGVCLSNQPYTPRYWSENQIREIVREEIQKDLVP